MNWEHVCRSSERFSAEYSRLYRINISSIFPQICLPIEKVFLLNTSVHFQFSLHFVTDEKRKQYFRRALPPIAVVLNWLNKLYEMGWPLPAYLKISKYCPIQCRTLKPSLNYEAFTDTLRQSGVRWKTFESKGVEIRAACGHLLSDIQF